MFNLKPLEWVLFIAVAYLLWDKFKPSKAVSTQSVTPLNGASVNTVPGIIDNGSGVGDNFDLQVEYLTRQMGY